MRSSVFRSIFFFSFSKIFCCVGIKEIVAVVVLGQPCVSRVPRERSGSGNGSSLYLDCDRITWHGERLVDNGTNGFPLTRHCQPCWAGDSPLRIKPQASMLVPVLFSSRVLSLPCHLWHTPIRPVYDRVLTYYGSSDTLLLISPPSPNSLVPTSTCRPGRK